MKRSPLVMLISLLLAAPSMAASPEFGVGVFGGYNTYRMNDVDFSVIPVDNLSSGISFGGGLRIRTSPSVLLSLDYERLTGTTSSFGSTNGVSYDLDLHMKTGRVDELAGDRPAIHAIRQRCILQRDHD